MKKKPGTKMVRMRIGDIERIKREAKIAQQKLPDFLSELIRARRRR